MESEFIMLLGHRVHSLLLCVVFGMLCLSGLMPCTAQPPPPITGTIANGQASVTVPFVPALADSGWIPVEVRLNGKGPYAFILDTGAARSAVSRDVASALGLPTNGKYRITTASKAEIIAEVKAVKTVGIGGVTLNNMRLSAVDLPANFPGQGILGADFLAQFVVTVDYQHQRILLTLPDKFSYKGQGEALPFKLSKHGIPFIVVSIEGVSGNFAVDTGSAGGLDLSRSFVQENHLRDKYPHHIETQVAIDLAGKLGTGWYVRAKTVKLSKLIVIHDIVLTLEDNDQPLDGIIGSVVLQQFTLTVDWPHHKFILEKNGLYGQKLVLNRAGFTPASASDGFNIAVVIPNSPASEAGLHVGDHLIKIDEQAALIWTLPELEDLACGDPGTKLPLTVERDGKRISVVLTLRDLL